MAFTIILSNMAGELDRRTAKDGREAAEVLAAMVEECGELSDGDTFTITEDE